MPIDGLDFDCCRPVTIITDDLLVFQGQIQRHERGKHEGDSFPQVIAIKGELEVEVEPEFISLTLSCTPVLLLPPATGVTTLLSLLTFLPGAGTTIRINTEQIIAVLPFSGTCLGVG